MSPAITHGTIEKIDNGRETDSMAWQRTIRSKGGLLTSDGDKGERHVAHCMDGGCCDYSQKRLSCWSTLRWHCPHVAPLPRLSWVPPCPHPRRLDSRRLVRQGQAPPPTRGRLPPLLTAALLAVVRALALCRPPSSTGHTHTRTHTHTHTPLVNALRWLVVPHSDTTRHGGTQRVGVRAMQCVR